MTTLLSRPNVVTLLALVVTTHTATAQGKLGYYRWPTLQKGTVVFSAEGDLWKVPVTGGLATRLTTHASEETRPQISSDGKRIAFSAAYEGPTEVYTMPIEGGLPTRQTFDGGAARVVSWTPRNTILYATGSFSGLPNVQLAEVDPATNRRRIIPLAQASDGVLAADGSLYFTRFDWQGSNTKRYRGGTAQNVWKWTGRGEATPLTTAYTGTSRSPMTFGDRLYYASDRTSATEKDPKPGVVNIWSSDLAGGSLRQETRHTDYDVLVPSMSADGKIVYQQGADIWMLDVSARAAARKIEIALASDLDQMRETWVTNPMSSFSGAHLSPNGDRVLLTALGHVWTAPVGQGRLALATPMTKDRFIRFRGARFMADGKSLVALSDESGEVEMWSIPANGLGERKQLTNDGTIVRWDAIPSPDGKRIAHHDRNNRLFVYDVSSKTNRVIATSMTQSNWITSGSGFFDLAWSPDSRWIAYGDVAPNMMARIALFDTETGRTTFATSDRFDSYSPAWSPDGKWLFFLSDRTFVSAVGSPWGMRAPDPYFENQTKLYALALQKTPPKFPFLQKTELDSADAARPTPPPAAPSPTTQPAVTDSTRRRPDAATPVRAVSIDLDGLAERLYELPVPAGNYSSLSMDGTRLFYRSDIAGTPRRRPLMQIEFKNDAKPDVYLDDVQQYELSQDRKKILIQRGSDLFVLDAAAKAPASIAERKLDLTNWSFPVNPVALRQQMFEDAWRLERDYFYDPKMNGVDWKAMREKYRPLAARVTSRAELSDVIAQMVAELSTLHIFVNGGDLRRGTENVVPASLGARLERDEESGGYRVAHIYRSDPDLPADRSPLLNPDVNVKEGDVIVAINGLPALTGDPSELLRNQAGKQVLITFKSSTSGAARQVVVVPWTQGRETSARYTEWEYTRRLLTDSLSGGKIGYLHLRSMGPGDINQFVRDYYPVFNRDGLILDLRNNTGGNVDSWILAKLMRKAWSYWQPRVGEPYWNMQYAFRGPMVVLVNERTASDGEAFAEGFRRLGLGKVIGTRTWGGEIWLSSDNLLVDRGVATAAQQAVYGMAERKMIIEGWGVDPDIVVDNLPAETYTGKDRQLEAAVRELLRARP